MMSTTAPPVVRAAARAFLIAALSLSIAAARGPVRRLPPAPGESTANLEESALGVLAGPTTARVARLRQTCLALPAIPENELPGAGGPSGAPCRVTELRALAGSGTGWAIARYQLGLHAYGKDLPAQPPSGAAAWEEVVLLELLGDGTARAVWHDRFVTDEDAVWRSVTPAVSRRRAGQILVGVAYCLNGTGGCAQEFLTRGSDRTWTAVRQPWRRQLPPGFDGRIRHGVSIDPDTLRGEAGFYGDGDPNCCPSQTLVVRLALRRSSLVLLRQTVVPSPSPGASSPAPPCAT
jgi:hypothetical protein